MYHFCDARPPLLVLPSTLSNDAQNRNPLSSYTDITNGQFSSPLVLNRRNFVLCVGNYIGATQTYEYAWGSSFHSPRFYKHLSDSVWSLVLVSSP